VLNCIEVAQRTQFNKQCVLLEAMLMCIMYAKKLQHAVLSCDSSTVSMAAY